MHEAKSVVGDHLRLTRAPCGQRSGPLSHVAHVVNGSTEGDGVAVDDARHDRRQFVSDRSYQCFVHQAETFLDTSEPQQCSCLVMPCQPHEIGISEALPDLIGLDRHGVAARKVTAAHMLQPNGNQQIAPLDAVAAIALKQPLRTGNHPVPRTRSPLNKNYGRSRRRTAQRGARRLYSDTPGGPVPGWRRNRHLDQACTPIGRASRGPRRPTARFIDVRERVKGAGPCLLNVRSSPQLEIRESFHCCHLSKRWRYAQSCE